jgi:hypothetical protein
MMTLTGLTYRRPDGSLVGVVNGQPYHLLDDPALCPPELWGQAQELHAALLDELPLEPAPELIVIPPAPEPTKAELMAQLQALSAKISALP